MGRACRGWAFKGRHPRNRRFTVLREEVLVSIVRIGLAETKNFSEGYEAIFGKKKATVSKKPKTVAKNSAAKKKKKAKKK